MRAKLEAFGSFGGVQGTVRLARAKQGGREKVQAIRTGDMVDMAHLQLPNMESESTACVQQVVRDRYTKTTATDDRFLSGNGTQPPECVRWAQGPSTMTAR